VKVADDGKHRNYEQPRNQVGAAEAEAKPHRSGSDKSEANADGNSSALGHPGQWAFDLHGTRNAA